MLCFYDQRTSEPGGYVTWGWDLVVAARTMRSKDRITEQIGQK